MILAHKKKNINLHTHQVSIEPMTSSSTLIQGEIVPFS